MFMGPFDQSIAWDDKGVSGLVRFLNRVWDLQTKIDKQSKLDQDSERILHQSIKKIGDDIMNMRFNTAISQLMILVNHFDKQDKITESAWHNILILLSPFAPHISEELWQLDHEGDISLAKWPVYNSDLLKNKVITVAIQINGKLRDTIELAIDTEIDEQLKQSILQRDKVLKSLDNKSVQKFIYIKNKIISIVAN
jgi:leucyl-tRNA synthetase